MAFRYTNVSWQLPERCHPSFIEPRLSIGETETSLLLSGAPEKFITIGTIAVTLKLNAEWGLPTKLVPHPLVTL